MTDLERALQRGDTHQEEKAASMHQARERRCLGRESGAGAERGGCRGRAGVARAEGATLKDMYM